MDRRPGRPVLGPVQDRSLPGPIQPYQKAVKIYMIFEKVGVGNIKYITTYSANSISELTNDKVQDIIDNFSEHNDIKR